MYQGFNPTTIKYFEKLQQNNNRAWFHENEALYLEGVREPLEEMYRELYQFFSEWDTDLLSNKRRCMSSAYNDARFCKDNPVKDYMYLRFKLNKSNERDVPGFFFDASATDFRYGLNLYHPSARGIERIREYMLDNKHSALEAITQVNESRQFTISGETYSKNSYTDEPIELQELLQRKTIMYSHEEPMNKTFFSRDLILNMENAYNSIRQLYQILKEASV